MKINVKEKSFSEKASLAGAGAALITAAAFCIYGAVYSQYADAGVAGFLLLGAAASLAYTFIDGTIADLGSLAGAFCVSFSMGLFFVNSYNVWADWYGNFHMYSSQGGIAPVIALLILYLVSIISNIVSCFAGKEEGGKA